MEALTSPDVYRSSNVHVFGAVGGITVRTESSMSLRFDRRAHLLASAYLPGFDPARNRWTSVPDAVISHTESDDKGVSVDGRTVSIRDR